MVLKDGATSYQPGLFVKAITTPNAVVHLEEINRPETDKALNAIFSVLDDSTRGIWLDEAGDAGAFVAVARGVSFFATLNEGYEYIGTMPLDVALADRFAMKLTLDYLPHEQELNLLMLKTPNLVQEQAEEIVTACRKLRLEDKDGSVSTRSMLYIGDYVARGMSFYEAFSSVVSSDKEHLERLLSAAHFSGQSTSYQEEEANYSCL
jgi:nitric oxide reductase NorQ protein